MNANREAKQINDPVAGVIRVEPLEQYVLDSPLVQRLRYIRQLGVGQVLFPTSAYSRFEHSLGAMHAATAMFDAVVTARPVSDAPIYPDDEFRWRRSAVRLAALLHDVGHCVFSHVSEKFYKHYAPLIDAQNFYRREAEYDTSSISASETLTLLLLQTKAFAELLQRAELTYHTKQKVPEFVRVIRACIAGSKKSVYPDAFLAEIINGPVDCDKLDYLARDAHFAGVPIALDTSRLLSKLRLATVKKDTGELHALTIVQSGTRALDELAVTRVFLYDKFYYHPKLMAAEEVIRSALGRLAAASPALANPVNLLALGDDELLHLSSGDFAGRLGVSADNADIARAVELFRRIRTRHLPKRAFAFAGRFLQQRNPMIARFEGDPEDSATEQSVDMQQFSRSLESAPFLDKFAHAIESSAKELGASTEVFVGHQNARRAGGSMHLDVMMEGGKVERAASLKFKSHEWTEAYALNRATSYVYAYDDLPKIHLAAEYVLATERGLRGFAPSCWMAAKVDADAVQLQREALPATWVDVRVRSDYLTSDESVARIAKLRARFSSFLTATYDSDVADEIVEAWVSQFPTADLQDSALRLLEYIQYVDPPKSRAAAEELVNANATLRDAIWVPLIKPADSGKSADQMVVDYKSLKVVKKRLGDLTSKDINTSSCIVFFDDALYTGTQSGTLLRSWFGIEDKERDSPGDRDAPRDPEIIDALKNARVEFVFYAAHPVGVKELERVAGEIGLGRSSVRVHATVDASDDLYTLNGFKAATAASTVRFLEFAETMGRALLEHKIVAKSWPKERPTEFALGYGQIRSTIVFRHSIATATPAVLWEMKEQKWMPIFPRKPEILQKMLRSNRVPDGELPEYDPLV